MALPMADACCAPRAKIIRMANISKAIRVAVGLYLLAAGGLKVHGLITDPFAQESLLFSPRLIIGAIVPLPEFPVTLAA